MFNQLTQKDIDAMEAEIEERKLVTRPKLLEAVKEARAHGDLSENFEYYAAKRGLVSIESPIGKALLGHKAGERVYVQVNGDYGYYLTVKSIENTVDDGSDKIRSF